MVEIESIFFLISPKRIHSYAREHEEPRRRWTK